MKLKQKKKKLNVFDGLKQSLHEALEYERGKGGARKRTASPTQAAQP